GRAGHGEHALAVRVGHPLGDDLLETADDRHARTGNGGAGGIGDVYADDFRTRCSRGGGRLGGKTRRVERYRGERDDRDAQQGVRGSDVGAAHDGSGTVSICIQSPPPCRQSQLSPSRTRELGPRLGRHRALSRPVPFPCGRVHVVWCPWPFASTASPSATRRTTPPPPATEAPARSSFRFGICARSSLSRGLLP